MTDSSFLNCKADCIFIQNSENINIDNNVFYDVWVIAVHVVDASDVTITNNLIIGVHDRPTMPEGADLVAGLVLYESIDPTTDNTIVSNNYCLGSSQHCFAFPMVKCSELGTNPFANNTAGSAKIGFIIGTIG